MQETVPVAVAVAVVIVGMVTVATAVAVVVAVVAIVASAVANLFNSTSFPCAVDSCRRVVSSSSFSRRSCRTQGTLCDNIANHGFDPLISCFLSVFGSGSDFDFERDLDLMQWIEARLGEKLLRAKDAREEDDEVQRQRFDELCWLSLRDGVALCKLVKQVDPSLIQKKTFQNTNNNSSSSPMARFHAIDNLRIYVKALGELGIKSCDLFDDCAAVYDKKEGSSLGSLSKLLQSVAALRRLLNKEKEEEPFDECHDEEEEDEDMMYDDCEEENDDKMCVGSDLGSELGSSEELGKLAEAGHEQQEQQTRQEDQQEEEENEDQDRVVCVLRRQLTEQSVRIACLEEGSMLEEICGLREQLLSQKRGQQKA